MNKFHFILCALLLISCTGRHNSLNPDDNRVLINAEKKSWTTATKATDTISVSSDVPWKVGEQVLLLRSDQTYDACTVIDGVVDEDGGLISGSITTYKPEVKTVCTVYQADGLKCQLVPETPLESGTYRAFYPYKDADYDIKWYDMVVMTFYFPSSMGLEYNSHNVVISDPVDYEVGDSISFVLNHLCALLNIDILPPKTGTFKYYPFLVAEAPVLASGVDYWLDREYNVPDDYSTGKVWVDFTALNSIDGRDMKQGSVTRTKTGILPLDYDGLPMRIYLTYWDGGYYYSEPFSLPSLSVGKESERIVVDSFTKTDEPFQGHWGITYGDMSHWDEFYPDHLFD